MKTYSFRLTPMQLQTLSHVLQYAVGDIVRGAARGMNDIERLTARIARDQVEELVEIFHVQENIKL